VVDLEPTITALRAAMVAALPELGANGVYEAEHADLVPWADFALPYGVILIDEVPRDEAGPLDETWLRPRVQLYYVMSVSGDSVGLRAKLQTLRAALWPTDPLAAANAGQIVSEVGWGWSADLPPNQVFRRDGVQRRAGRLVLDVLVAGS
jgi:hypothetical protein